MMGKKMGRPTDYTEELAQEICNTIASSSSGLIRLCKENPHWPARSKIFEWRLKHQKFRDMYDAAKREQVEALVDECLDISDDVSNDTIVKTTKDGDEHEVQNGEWINRSRLRVDTRKFIAAKLAPKLYGTKGIEIGVEGSLLEKIIDKL